MSKKVGVVSLGCSKNLVSSEQMLWLLDGAGYEITPEAEGADVVVINTCAFIESAKSEGIESILELALLKKEGKIKKLIAAGCMAQRYKDEILRDLPEVDGLVGCGSFFEIVDAVDQVLDGGKPCLMGDIDAPIDECGRVISTPPYTAYLKIAEGCDNRCAYCVIPSLRGRYRSRPMESIVEEARALSEGGTKELIIVAQDITRYGEDLYKEPRLAALLRALCRLPEIHWIRLHYMYPDGFTEELISTIAEEEKILNYLDIPIQHISDRLLAAMNRRATGAQIETLFETLRARIPGLALRTSLIAGLPGETDQDFEQLCAFLKRAQIERAGVFPYSPEEGTPAADMPDQVPDDVKNRRVEVIMGIQQRIMDAYNRRLRGQTMEVLCEGYDRYAECYYGRSFADSPEIDGKVFFDSKKKLSSGELVPVRITGKIGDDLRGVYTGPEE